MYQMHVNQLCKFKNIYIVLQMFKDHATDAKKDRNFKYCTP